MSSPLPKILVLISGSGSNLQALIDATKNGKLPAEISYVISSSPSAYGLIRASNAGIPSYVHTLKTYFKGIPKENKEGRRLAREKFNKDLAEIILEGAPKEVTQGTKMEDQNDSTLEKGLEKLDIKENTSSYTKPDLIVCAGWMLILSPSFLTPLAEKYIPIINLHPALPGAFAGTHAIDRAWQAGQDGTITKAGLMIHKVIVEVDEGDPLIVKELDLIKGETLESYENRVHVLEHIAIVEGANRALVELVKKNDIKESNPITNED